MKRHKLSTGSWAEPRPKTILVISKKKKKNLFVNYVADELAVMDFVWLRSELKKLFLE